MPEYTVTPAQFMAMSPRLRIEALQGLSTTDQSLMRVFARVETLKAASDKLRAWLLKRPSGYPGHAGRVRRLQEYETSLENLGKYRQERPPTGNPIGVEIGIPHVFTGRRA